MTAAIEKFWQNYLNTLPETERNQPMPEAWGFGDGAAMADELGALVVAGTKTATCGAFWEYEAEGEAIPQEGELSIVTDGNGDPMCIIQTTEVETKPFNQVDAQFAFDEGEGDRTLAYWRKVHWEFFTRSLKAIQRTPSETMPLVCERFKVIYKI